MNVPEPRRQAWLVASAFTLMVQTVLATEIDLLELALEQLLEVTVVSASKFGQRSNDNIYHSAMTGTEAWLDLSAIERIEYIPGSGSALYGSSAMFGVVNVMTRQGEADGRREAGLRLSSQGNTGVNLISSQTLGSEAQDTRVFLQYSADQQAGRDQHYSDPLGLLLRVDGSVSPDGMSHGLDSGRNQHLMARADRARYLYLDAGLGYYQNFDDVRGLVLAWHRNVRSRWQFSLYQNQLDDLIPQVDTPGSASLQFQNRGTSRIQGLELGLEEIQASASAPLLHEALLLAGELELIGPRTYHWNSSHYAVTTELPAHVTATLHRLSSKGWQTQWRIHNLFNRQIAHPASPEIPSPAVRQPGREVSALLSYAF